MDPRGQLLQLRQRPVRRRLLLRALRPLLSRRVRVLLAGVVPVAAHALPPQALLGCVAGGGPGVGPQGLAGEAEPRLGGCIALRGRELNREVAG